MHAYEITGYAHDDETYCADCYRARIADAEESAGTDCTDDDAATIYASTETDTPQHCADCGCLIETAWTRDCRRYVAEKIAEYVTDGAGDPDTLQAWADYASMSADVADARRIYAEIGGTWTHGTLRTVDLLDAAARCAESLADLCPDDAADLHRLAAEAHAIAHPDADEEPEETYQEEEDRAAWTLEEITDAIAAALPTPLYYGCTEGDGSDIGVWCSAED